MAHLAVSAEGESRFSPKKSFITSTTDEKFWREIQIKSDNCSSSFKRKDDRTNLNSSFDVPQFLGK